MHAVLRLRIMRAQVPLCPCVPPFCRANTSARTLSVQTSPSLEARGTAAVLLQPSAQGCTACGRVYVTCTSEYTRPCGCGFSSRRSRSIPLSTQSICYKKRKQSCRYQLSCTVRLFDARRLTNSYSQNQSQQHPLTDLSTKTPSRNLTHPSKKKSETAAMLGCCKSRRT